LEKLTAFAWSHSSQLAAGLLVWFTVWSHLTRLFNGEKYSISDKNGVQHVQQAFTGLQQPDVEPLDRSFAASCKTQ